MSLFLLKELPGMNACRKLRRTFRCRCLHCEVYMNLLHTGEVIARAEAAFLSRFGLNQARMVLLFILDASRQEHEVVRDRGEIEREPRNDHGHPRYAGKGGTRGSRIGSQRSPRFQRENHPGGEKLLAKVRPEFMRWSAGTVGTFIPQERKQLVELLRKTRQSFEEPSIGSASRNGCHD